MEVKIGKPAIAWKKFSPFDKLNQPFYVTKNNAIFQ